MTLFTDDMTMNKENPKESTNNQLELVNEFIKAVRYKVNIKRNYKTQIFKYHL